MKIAIVVQRYGAEINGGAELHARYIAEHLAPHVQVEVLTTCATDYVTWRNSVPAGIETVHGVSVRRFPVSRERDPEEFGRLSDRVFLNPHSVRDELNWLDAEGPTSPELISYIQKQHQQFDFFIFFSVRYYHTFHGARAVPGKAVVVPTAERDGALGLSIFGPVFRGVRAFMYNSFEERALINGASGNQDVPGVVVGVGSAIPDETSPARFRQKFNFRDRFAIYVGRIDENKGCGELFEFFQRYSRMMAEGMHLVLIGTPIIPIPEHPRIHHLGFVSDQDKFDAMAAAELLVMPSYLESLSMVALEAWALGKPVLANGKCDVLRGQCVRSNGGLYYENFPEFLETLRAIDMGPALALALGRNGREYFRKHYTWPIIERKYLDMLERLGRETPKTTMEPLPGWLAKRRNTLRPADEIVAALPTGPALGDVDRPAAERAPAAHPRPDRSMPSPPAASAPVPRAAVSSGAGERPPSTDRRPQSSDRRPQRRDRRPMQGSRHRQGSGQKPGPGQPQPKPQGDSPQRSPTPRPDPSAGSSRPKSRDDKAQGRPERADGRGGPRRRRRRGPPRRPN